MRTDKALKNSFFSIVSYFILIIFGFVTQRIFKDTFGKEYLGVSTLFVNIISGLNVVELGFGSAIIANMYKPVADNDIELINSLLKYYKKVYRYIAFIIFISGLVILPFIKYIVGNITIDINLRLTFLFYLFDSVSSYFLTYRRSVLYATQQSYYTNIVHTLAVAMMNSIQIVILLVFKNFYLYLLISILFKLFENIIINIIVFKKYPQFSVQYGKNINRNIAKDISRKVYGLFFHKIASFIVFGTDNIVISMLPNLGIGWVALYSSYSLITTKLTSLVDNIFNAVTASIGNLIVKEEKEKIYNTFKNIKLINTWIYVFVSISFYYLSFPFISIWMGQDFVLDKVTVLIITLNLYIGGIRATYGTFKNAAGIFFEDRYIPIVESIVNIVFSIPLAFLFGLKGVLFGTILSTMVLFAFSYPKYVYNLILSKDIGIYIRDLFDSFIQFLISFSVTAICMVFTNNIVKYEQLFIRFLICIIVPNFTMFIINKHKKEFAFIEYLIKKLLLFNKKR